jgi:hypothetical protein
VGSPPPCRVLFGGDFNVVLPASTEGLTGSATFCRSVKAVSLQKEARSAWVMRLMARYRLIAANAFPTGKGESSEAWATWGTGKEGAWIPHSQLDYLLLQPGNVMCAKVLQDPQRRFSDHRPVHGVLAMQPEADDGAWVEPAFPLTGWSPSTQEDGARYRRCLRDALVPPPSSRTPQRRVRFIEEEGLRASFPVRLEEEMILHAKWVNHTTTALSQWAARQPSAAEVEARRAWRHCWHPEERALARRSFRRLRRQRCAGRDRGRLRALSLRRVVAPRTALVDLGEGLESDVTLQRDSLHAWCLQKLSLPGEEEKNARDLGLARALAGAVSAVAAARVDGTSPAGRACGASCNACPGRPRARLRERMVSCRR